MNILITGGDGFLGSQVARELQKRREPVSLGGVPSPVEKIFLADVAFGPKAREGLGPDVFLMEGDIGSADFCASLLHSDPAIVFHLAAMVSVDGERDFDGCLRTNLDGTRHLLEACRKRANQPTVVLASSLAVFGGSDMPPIVSDQTKALPQTTYGMTKLIGELLVNDYSRKGFIDGRAARLPTVFIRPGRPNAAASSFASSLFREPLNGETCFLPVPRSQAVPLLGYRRVVQNLICLAQCAAALLGDDRTVTMPSTRYEISAMIASLEKIAKQRAIRLGPIVDQPDARTIAIVRGWPVGTDAGRASSIGMRADESVEQVITEYIEDFL